MGHKSLLIATVDVNMISRVDIPPVRKQDTPCLFHVCNSVFGAIAVVEGAGYSEWGLNGVVI